MANINYQNKVPQFVGVVRLVIPSEDANEGKVCHMAILADSGNSAQKFNAILNNFVKSDITKEIAMSLLKTIRESDETNIQKRLRETGDQIANKIQEINGCQVRYLFPKQVGLHGLGQPVELSLGDMCVRLIHTGELSNENPMRLLAIHASSFEESQKTGEYLDSKEDDFIAAMEQLNHKMIWDKDAETRSDALYQFASEIYRIADNQRYFLSTVTFFRNFTTKTNPPPTQKDGECDAESTR